jgi:hypothetical protein
MVGAVEIKMTKLQESHLKRIFKQAVVQGQHENNLKRIYKLLREAAEIEFTEDNMPTLDAFMLECFEASQSVYYKAIPRSICKKGEARIRV